MGKVVCGVTDYVLRGDERAVMTCSKKLNSFNECSFLLGKLVKIYGRWYIGGDISYSFL